MWSAKSGRYESNKPVKSKLTCRQSINQSTKRFTIKVYAWLIDFAHFWENCPTGMISGWVQNVTQHNGIIQLKNQSSHYKLKTYGRGQRGGRVSNRHVLRTTNERHVGISRCIQARIQRIFRGEQSSFPGKGSGHHNGHIRRCDPQNNPRRSHDRTRHRGDHFGCRRGRSCGFFGDQDESFWCGENGGRDRRGGLGGRWSGRGCFSDRRKSPCGCGGRRGGCWRRSGSDWCGELLLWRGIGIGGSDGGHTGGRVHQVVVACVRTETVLAHF